MLAIHADSIALVLEEYKTWGGSFWNIPSGAVESNESPGEGAARELLEETGLRVTPEQLQLVSTSTSRFQGGESQAWNFTARVEEPTLRSEDPEADPRRALVLATGCDRRAGFTAVCAATQARGGVPLRRCKSWESLAI